jgi:hypothetical protein
MRNPKSPRYNGNINSIIVSSLLVGIGCWILLLGILLPVVGAFAAGKGGASSGGGGGFGKKPVESSSSSSKTLLSEPFSTSTTAIPTPAKPRFQTIDLGRNKAVRLLVPPDALDQQLQKEQQQKQQPQQKSKKSKKKKQTTVASVLAAHKDQFYGTGDVLWLCARTIIGTLS